MEESIIFQRRGLVFVGEFVCGLDGEAVASLPFEHPFQLQDLTPEAQQRLTEDIAKSRRQAQEGLSKLQEQQAARETQQGEVLPDLEMQAKALVDGKEALGAAR